MKKIIRLEDLDCANCAAKMENSVRKIDGVGDATVSFMNQKMTLELDEERADEILKEVRRVCGKIEPDCILHI